HAVLDHHRMVGQARLTVGVKHAVHHVTGWNLVESLAHQSARLELSLHSLHLPTVERFFERSVYIRIGQAFDVTLTSLEKTKTMQPLQLMADAFIPLTIRNYIQCRSDQEPARSA